MNRRSALAFLATPALGSIYSCSAAIAQQRSIKDLLVGTWSYVSSNAKQPDGSSLWGENAKGLFILTEGGSFSWQIFRWTVRNSRPIAG